MRDPKYGQPGVEAKKERPNKVGSNLASSMSRSEVQGRKLESNRRSRNLASSRDLKCSATTGSMVRTVDEEVEVKRGGATGPGWLEI